MTPAQRKEVDRALTLVAAIAGEKLIELCELKHELNETKKQLIESQQKHLAVAAKLHVYVTALVNAHFMKFYNQSNPKQTADEYIESLYMAVDKMLPKPDATGYLVEVIRKTGETWK